MLLPSNQSRNLLVAFGMMSISMGGPILAILTKRQIAISYGVPEFVTASLYALFFLIVGLGGGLVSKASDKLGFRAICVTAGLSTIAGSVLCYYTENVFVFGLSFGLLICFLGSAPFFAPLVALTLNFFPNRPALNVAIPTMGQLVSFGPWRLVFDLASAPANWRLGFLALACGGVLQIIFGFMFNLQKDTSLVAPRDWQWRGVPLWPFGANLFLLMLGATIFITSLKEIETDRNLGQIGLFGIFSVFALLGRLCFAFFFDSGKHSAAIWISNLCTLMACGIFLISAEFPVLTFLASAALGFGYSGYLPVMVAFTKLHCRGSRQRNARRILMLGAVGVAAGSILSGFFLPVVGFQLKFLLAFGAGLLSIGMVIFGLLRLRGQ
jgi:MFS family permease